MSLGSLMRQLQISLVPLGLVSLLAVALASCGNGDSQKEPEPKDTQVDQLVSDQNAQDWADAVGPEVTDAGGELPLDSIVADRVQNRDSSPEGGLLVDLLDPDLGADSTDAPDLWSKCDPKEPAICSPAGDVVRCNAEGTGYDLVTDCINGSQFCAFGRCIEIVCMPGTGRCDGDTLVLCSFDGQREDLTVCAESEMFCDSETISCLPWVCTPGVSSCSETADAVKCNAVGSGFDLANDCGSLGCLEGACIKGCGDNLCADGEDCNNCVEDCGCGTGLCRASGACCALACEPEYDCASLCQEQKAGPGSLQPFDPQPENSLGVGLDAGGSLVMDSSKLDLHALWVVSSAEDTVTRIDTRTGRQVARLSVCDNPARVAVDLVGDLWVGCLGDPSVVKVAGSESRCIDRNDSGTIETSRDLNADGVFQLEEVLDGEQDECILFATNPGGKIIRAIGVDGENHCWAGSWSSAELYRLNPDDGQVLRTIKLPKPAFGLVIDSEGVIWCSTLGTTLLRVAGAYVFSVASPSNYGISLDNRGRVWIGGSLSRFDPVSYQWTSTGLNALGVAGSTDGFVYGATGSTLYRVNMDTMAAEAVDTQGLGANGVALDSDGYVWTVNNGSSNASKVNPGTKEVLGLYPVSPGGETFSDLTGYTLNNFTAPSGFLEFTLGGATETPVKWKQLRFGAAFPEGTWVEVQVRAGDTIQALPEAKWQGPVALQGNFGWPLSLKDIPNLEGRFLQVRLGMHSQHRPTTPTVWSVEADGER